MNDQFQQLISIDHTISKQTPTPLEKSEKSVAVVAHVFYIDIWQEISDYLNNLEIAYDLFVTVPAHMPDKDVLTIFDTHPEALVYMAENRGRDVLPFLQVMQVAQSAEYKYICKIHTKKTGESALGHVWRKLLYFDLLGSNQTVTDIIDLFDKHADIGIVTGKNTILDSQRYAYGNNDKIDILADKSNYIFDENYLFPAGTMFWIRSELLEPILTLFNEGELEFEEEKGQKDDTLAHAIERFFGIICQKNDQKIVESPSDYTQLESETINELSALVLSQQYVGVDMFVEQKHAITTKDIYIQQLEELAESLRIKNRLKRLLPRNIKSKAVKSLELIKVVKNNPQVLKKVFYYLSRGDIAYLWSKTKEKSNKNLSESAQLVEINPAEYFKRFDPVDYLLEDITIDIIIPVYNGYEFLEKLFNSIEKNTTSPYRLIVINDCSPDERVKPYLLERLKSHPEAIFIDHAENQGFLKSVNEAYTHVSNHFLLLNTDTEVPEFWMERLMYPIIHMDKVASTTPFTNSGEIASFPSFVADNDIFDGMHVNELDKAFREIDPKYFYTEVPTGVGFCMGVNYTLTKEIGLFVEDTFGKGYGEENDWCQRAIQKGYRNFIVPNLFVYHKHGGSFSAEEKRELIKVNAIKLLDKHPNYGKDVNRYIQNDPHKTLRQMLVLLAADKKAGTHLIFDHDLGGGANIYTNEKVEKQTKKRINTLLIRYDFYSNHFKIFHYYKKYTFSFKIATFEDLQELIAKLNLKEIFLNSLVSFKNCTHILAYFNDLVEKTNAKLLIPIHDYYTICPSYTLQNEEGRYCNVPSIDVCKSCMSKSTQEWRNFYKEDVNIVAWRQQWSALLEKSNHVICFSNASKEIVLKAYPDLAPNKIEVIPHQVPPLPPVKCEPKETTTLTVGILGAINFAKGSQIIKHLVQTIERDNLDINVVLIGEMSEALKSDRFHLTGRYKREELPTLIKNEQIDIFLIPSIVPETFSYTTQEIMMMEMPLMVFNLGAPAERVKNYPKGYIIDDLSAEAVLETLRSYQDIEKQ